MYDNDDNDYERVYVFARLWDKIVETKRIESVLEFARNQLRHQISSMNVLSGANRTSSTRNERVFASIHCTLIASFIIRFSYHKWSNSVRRNVRLW